MRYTVKIKIENEMFYQYWSNLINAPVTYILNELDWMKFYKDQYGELAYNQWKLGYRRFDTFNNSLKLYNKNHENINKKEFICKYKVNYKKDLLVITEDKIKPIKYLYKGKIYEVLLTTFHKELNKNFIICNTDNGYTYLDFNVFLNPNLYDILG